MSVSNIDNQVKSLEELLQEIRNSSAEVNFDDVIATINKNYQYTPTSFRNGLSEKSVFNDAGKNEGSCRIFYFARLNDLTESETLNCFGKFYREDVLGNPDGDDHMNIRNFMNDGWAGILFEGEALRRS